MLLSTLHASKRIDGVELGGLPRRCPAEADAHRSREAYTQDDGAYGHHKLRSHHIGEDDGQQQSQRHTRNAADDGQQEGLDEELHLDLPGDSAQRLLQADLRGALGDGGEHHVHDADAAHHQRNGGDACQQGGHHAQHFFHGVLHAGHGGDGEAILLVGEHDVHGGLDLAGGLLGISAVGQIHGEGGHQVVVAQLQGGGVGEQDIRAAGEHIGDALGVFVGEKTHHREGNAADVQAFAHGINAVEEGLHQFGADEAHEGHIAFVDHIQRPAAGDHLRVGAEVVGVLAGDRHAGFIRAAAGHPHSRGYCGGQPSHQFKLRQFVQVIGGEACLQVAARYRDRQRACTHGGKAAGQRSGNAVHRGDQRDHRRDADEDAQHREEGTHLVAPDVFQGHGDAFPQHDEDLAQLIKHGMRRLLPSVRRR